MDLLLMAFIAGLLLVGHEVIRIGWEVIEAHFLMIGSVVGLACMWGIRLFVSGRRYDS